ncbi:MAG TPA: histidine ammonia-lyase [Candidatus Dormibacteraeota bacterium]
MLLRGRGLTPEEVVAVARDGEQVELHPDARQRMLASRAHVEAAGAAEHPVYGVSTGFGALAQTRIDPEDRSGLQHALIRSHAAGVGDPVPAEVVRAMMLLRARTLAMGYSGARPVVAETLLALLNAGITPRVPEYGSVGCSGDLAPLAHIALVLVGDESPKLLAAAGIEPLRLEAKEGLALINGTDGMLALLLLACHDLRRLLLAADVAAAMSVEALLGTDRVFDAELMALRPQPGQSASAENLRRLLAGSDIVASHRQSAHTVQDSYSMRCHPQVAGAVRDVLGFAETVAARELESAVDNPAVLVDGRIESNGNFHGAPLGYAADFLAIAVADLASISERRVDRLLDRGRSAGLPAFLAPEPGVNSGLMVVQYSAAALVADMKRLAVPASVDSIPTSALQEDHVSMGWAAGLKLRQSVASLARVIAIEVTAAARGLDLRLPLTAAPATGAARDLVRRQVPGPGPDRSPAPDLLAVERLVSGGALVDAVTATAGLLV